VIRENAEALGFRGNFSIYDEGDRTTLIKESLRECRMSAKKVDLWELGQLFSKVKTGICGWEAGSSLGLDARPVYDAYQQGLKLYNAVDFDDLLVLPLELLEGNPEILGRYHERFRYILVDEFQDTSVIQYRLMSLLAKSGSRANICVVGDDDQSIYSWRGANFGNILMFEKDFPGMVEIKLEQNYRSTRAILDAANGVISHNLGRKEKRLWSGLDGGRPIEIHHPENEKAEAEFIAGRIRDLMLEETRRYHEFGVLTRTNSLGRNIEEAFLAADIPYKVSGGTSFFQRKEVKDIISYMRVAANPEDDLSLIRVINTPPRGIGRSTVAVLGDIARRNRVSLWQAVLVLNRNRSEGQQLFQDGKGLSELEEFAELIGRQRAALTGKGGGEGGRPKSLAERTRALVQDVDYWGYLVGEHGKGDKEEKKALWKFANIEHYVKMIENWEKHPDTADSGLYAWLNRISLITRDDGETDSLGKVSLTTIHAAKGLEFPVVFVAGVEDGLIPHRRSTDEDELDERELASNLEEERRLFYVAMTRAMRRLYLTCCVKRRRQQGEEECEPSPFLEEIPAELLREIQPPTQEEEEAASERLLKLMKERFGKKDEG
ncbi:MAG: UvrD-helicase domain-containing protein, partial [Treponema sp.]|nr:UvrD-helicase domain-containing protein [Treponema sp.]